MKVGLVDYSMGNMHSVSRAIQQANQQVCVVRSESELAQVHILVVPGVGHFDLAMKKLEQKGLRTGIAKWIAKGNPYIGICLGMHILFETSEEGKEEGLGVYKEQVKRLPVKVIPHMGWNRLECQNSECQNSEWVNWKAWPNAWAYFVHSYGVMASSQACATTTYEKIQMVAAIEKDNCFAMQFHPEKSGEFGLWLWREVMKKAASL
jgi:glutamine amidotransferase|uniref:Imidazole glycerol phosphate synthase subunit hisH n=2 Tax=Cyanidioschyzon merolae TaxID=45157 RepID=HIS5_CYAM1|nr:imidazole glycerol phosphate synthase subunit hisH [Cyanidioschyzon merolae strain 10D]Q85FY4.1 RecName: Full=Imidazole glycerol phosphate synthase subunit hisH; AltName: Full=IGP synthase glutaminase subunit; AltName: Full=IGP synthase subunit hisH; AltName: Full=ImGP synthase subunit hisH; Short=IGPS subunit hisH [Cyanidioschyzon merolae strain 10D]QFV17000.1 amidotransferase hisH [Cyanidioschyzon merolae]BAC76209.1 amidotransferase hisH [Cyanidioschyzon merolae strain 10D]